MVVNFDVDDTVVEVFVSAVEQVFPLQAHGVGRNLSHACVGEAVGVVTAGARVPGAVRGVQVERNHHRAGVAAPGDLVAGADVLAEEVRRRRPGRTPPELVVIARGHADKGEVDGLVREGEGLASVVACVRWRAQGECLCRTTAEESKDGEGKRRHRHSESAEDQPHLHRVPRHAIAPPERSSKRAAVQFAGGEHAEKSGSRPIRSCVS